MYTDSVVSTVKIYYDYMLIRMVTQKTPYPENFLKFIDLFP